MDKVEERLGCWAWTASATRGVGAFRREGSPKTESAARVSYAHFVGRIPLGAEIAPTCGLRSCVRPEHLAEFPRGTGTRNNPKPSPTHCKYGHSLEDAYITKDGRRDCRQCSRVRKYEWRKINGRGNEKRYPPKPREVKCPDCGEKRIISYASTSKRCKRCSIVATGKTLRSRRLVTCQREGCENVFRTDGKQRFCSRTCYFQDPSSRWSDEERESRRQQMVAKDRNGARNPNFKHVKRIGDNLRGWSVLEKGDFQCRNCGVSDRALHLHHVVPRSVCPPEAKRDLRNGIPLCNSCHAKWHMKSLVIKRSAFTEEEWGYISMMRLTSREITGWLNEHYP